MNLTLKSPQARYYVIKMDVPANEGNERQEIGPVLVATYDQKVFEVLHPYRQIIKPLDWELVREYGFFAEPDEPMSQYLSDYAEVLLSAERLELTQPPE